MSADVQQFDIVVVGAGMVGAAFACSLRELPVKVAVLDTAMPSLAWPAEGYDLRVSAITRASQNILQNIGAWSAIHAERVSPYREMHVWDATGSGQIHFDSAEIGEADLGHIIENRVIVKALHQQLQQQHNLTCFIPARLQNIVYLPEHAQLSLEDGRELQTKLVVAADGGRSWVRQQAGIAVRGWDYDQAALVTYVKTEQWHQETAWQRFLPTGPLAFLPLTEGYSSIVWSTTPQQAEALRSMPADQFAVELSEAFAGRLGAVSDVGPRAVFPLRFFETEHYVAARLALLGDAAHTIHPLAGQGVNLGFADAASLTEVLSDALVARQDPGSYPVLRRYERWRRAENHAVFLAMDSFKRLFSSESEPLRTIRNLGLNLTDKLSPLKHFIMRQAMGTTTAPGEHRPQLARWHG